MTTLQVHLLMIGLGLIAYLFLAGLLSNRKSYSKRLRRKWRMGALAGIAVAASPFSRFWRDPVNSADLLAQSLLIAAICVLALLLFTLLRYSIKAIMESVRNRKAEKKSAQAAQSKPLVNEVSTPITINANNAKKREVNSLLYKQSASVTVDRSNQRPAKSKTSQNKSSVGAQANIDRNKQRPAPVDNLRVPKVTKNINSHAPNLGNGKTEQPIENDQPLVKTIHAAGHESGVKMEAKNKGAKLDKSFRKTSAANDNNGISALSIKPLTDKQLNIPPGRLGNEKLDLSETEQLFAELRTQKNEVKLPGEDELRQAKANSTIDELDLDTDLMQKIETSTNSANTSHDVIEEAEVVEIDNSLRDFGNDVTGEYSHPAMAKKKPELVVLHDPAKHKSDAKVPATLDDAIIAAKVTAVSLQAQVASLETSIAELDDLRDATIDATAVAAQVSAEHSVALLKQKDDLLRSEDEARVAAESVIAAQSALIDRAKREQALINSMLNKERARLGLLQEEVTRSRKMARSAATLARRAAIEQHKSRHVAQREQHARLKSQESTRKAVTIARNAISALAAEERKHGTLRR